MIDPSGRLDSLAAAGCLPLLAGSRRLRATAACCWLLPLQPDCHPERGACPEERQPRREGSRSSRKRATVPGSLFPVPAVAVPAAPVPAFLVLVPFDPVYRALEAATHHQHD